MKRIYPVVIIIIALAIGSVFVLTQFKSYHVITEPIVPTSGSSTMDFPFTIEKAEKPWKLQFNIQTELIYYSEVYVQLLTIQDNYLWSKTLYKGTYEYEFIHTGDLKIRIHIYSYDPAPEIEFKILAWKSFLGW